MATMATLIRSVLGLAMALSATLDAGESQWARAIREGDSARQSAKMQDAERAYDEAVNTASSDPTMSVQQAIAIGRRASLFHDLQRCREAERGYLQAVELLRQHGPESTRRYGIPLIISLASLYLEQGEPSKAKRLKLEDLASSIESPADIANAHGALGSIAFAQGRYVEAETLWRRSMEVSEAHGETEDVAVALNSLGLAASMRGEFEAGTAYFRQSIERLTSSLGPEHPLLVKVQGNLGQALYRLRRYGEATEFLEKAHNLAQRWYGSENTITAQLCVARAEALRKSGRKQEAKVLLDASRQLPASVRAALPGRSTIDVLQVGSVARK